MDNIASLTAGLKVYYARDKVQSQTAENRPLFGMVRKKTDVGGSSYDYSLLHEDQHGAGVDFATAQAGAAAGQQQIKRVSVKHCNIYSIAQMDGVALRRLGQSAQSLLADGKKAFDGAINVLGGRLQQLLYRGGWGAVARIGSISTNTITLLDQTTAVLFHVGQRVVFSASESANTLRNTGATTTLTITGVNRSSGILTFSANVSTVTGTAANDYIFFVGDRQDSATPARLVITGLEGWCPQTAPTTGDNFWGVDRSVDVERLAGSRVDLRGTPAEEAVQQAATIVNINGGKIDTYFVPPSFFLRLTQSMGSKVEFDRVKIDERIGYRTVVVTGPTNDIRIVPDAACPADRMFGVWLDDLEFFSCGETIRLIDDDGNSMLRMANGDVYEARFSCDGNLAVQNPINMINARIA